MRSIKKMTVIFTAIAIMMCFTGTILADQINKVNINTATLEDLIQLKRVGPIYAERIIKYREANGLFKTPEEIMNVPGIGQKTFEANKDIIIVE